MGVHGSTGGAEPVNGLSQESFGDGSTDQSNVALAIVTDEVSEPPADRSADESIPYEISEGSCHVDS